MKMTPPSSKAMLSTAQIALAGIRTHPESLYRYGDISTHRALVNRLKRKLWHARDMVAKAQQNNPAIAQNHP